jgi:anti-sigma regulatory factor (Ser/Thr protein kinase)
MAREKTKYIQSFIIRNLSEHPHDIVALTSSEFSISRQAAHKHVHKLVKNQVIEIEGNTRSRTYKLKTIFKKQFNFTLTAALAEDRVWRQDVAPLLKTLSQNILHICHYGFTEMFNNAIDHSEGDTITVVVALTAARLQIQIEDNGVGIFNKIKDNFGLEDQRHAILELVKGKLTTSPDYHTGEGIFFTSRMFDKFALISYKLTFTRKIELGSEGWLIENLDQEFRGTRILMEVSLDSPRTTQEVFSRYTLSAEDTSFAKTHVPVSLSQYGEENLVSRSQAKRLLARFDKFKEVFLDFKNVKTIGRAFADEIFRVFKNQNPHIKIVWINANPEIETVIRGVLNSIA